MINENLHRSFSLSWFRGSPSQFNAHGRSMCAAVSLGCSSQCCFLTLKARVDANASFGDRATGAGSTKKNSR